MSTIHEMNEGGRGIGGVSIIIIKLEINQAYVCVDGWVINEDGWDFMKVS